MYRPFLKEEIIKVVRTCDVCQKIKTEQSKKLAEMLIITPTKPNQLITTDIAGPLKETIRGNKYFIVVIDHFTKYIQIYPMKKIQAEDVAHALVDEWMMIFGIPESILADGGTQYQSKLLEAVYEYLDITGLKTTPFNPQCNGQSERTVQTAKSMMRAHIDDNQSNWDLNLSKIAFAYNTSVHQATKITPFELQFGRKPAIPIDILLPNTNLHEREIIIKEFQTNDSELGEITVLEDIDEKIIELKLAIVAKNYLDNLRTTMENSFKLAQNNRNSRMDLEKIKHDRKIKKLTYKIGDYVLCDHPRIKKGMSRGIAHKYYGPFEIKKVDSNKVDYYIQRTGTRKGKIYKIHQNRLKFYHYKSDKSQIDTNESSGSEINIKKMCKKTKCNEAESLVESNSNNKINKKKRKYVKNLKNPRWNKKKSTGSECEPTTSETSEDESSEATNNSSTDTNIETEDESPEIKKSYQRNKSKSNSKIEIKKINQKRNINKQVNEQISLKNSPRRNQNFHYTRSRQKKNDNINKTNELNSEKSMEKNDDEQHLKNNCKYNLRSRKKNPIKINDRINQ